MFRLTRRVWAAITVVAVASLLSNAALFARPASHAQAKHFTFYLIPGISTDAFYITMHKGAQAAATKLGVTLKFQGAPNAFSAPTQIPFLNGAIAAHPDAILIAPTDKTALIAPIQRAINAGIPVITVDTFITKPIAVTNISSDNVKGGKLAADALASVVGHKGAVAGLSVTPGISTTDQRKQGFDQELKRWPSITNLGTQFDNDQPTVAATKTQALITGHANLKGIFAMNTNSGLGAIQGVKNAGKAHVVKLVEFDAEPIEVQALKQGTVDALIAQDPFTIGSKGVNLAYKWVTGHRAGIKKHYGTGEAIITARNVNNPSIKRFLYTK